MTVGNERIRMVVAADWDEGFQLTPGTNPPSDILPGSEYVVECAAPRPLVLEAVTVRDYALDRLYVGASFASFVDDESADDSSPGARHYRLEPLVTVSSGENIRAVLKNASDAPRRPKVAVLIRAGREVIAAAPRSRRSAQLSVSSIAQVLSPRCPTCDSSDREDRRQMVGGRDGARPFCGDAWHDGPAESASGHAPQIARTLYNGLGNATLVQGCSCGATVASARAFAEHVNISESAFDAMLGLVGVICDLCHYPAEMTREETARRVARCLTFPENAVPDDHRPPISASVLAVKPHPGQATSNPGCWAVQLRVSHAGQSRTFWRWHLVRKLDERGCYVTPPNNEEPSHNEILARFWHDTFAELHGFNFNFHDD